MRQIDLDAETWQSPADFYAALLPALGAPDWHGDSIAAITDSMIGGEINAVDPPYVVRIHNLAGRLSSVVDEVEYAEGAIARARAGMLARYDERVDAYLEIVGGNRAAGRAGGALDPERLGKGVSDEASGDDFERLRESLRPHAPFHVSRQHFESFDDGADRPAERDDGDRPADR